MRRILLALALATPSTALAADSAYSLQLVIGGSTNAPAGLTLADGAIAASIGAAPGAAGAVDCGLVRTGDLLAADAACQASLASASTALPAIYLPDTAGTVHTLQPPQVAWENATVLSYTRKDQGPLVVGGEPLFDSGTWPCRKAGGSWSACTVTVAKDSTAITLPTVFGPLQRTALQLAGPYAKGGHSVTFLQQGSAPATSGETACAMRERHLPGGKSHNKAASDPQSIHVCLNAAGVIDVAPSAELRDMVIKPNRTLTLHLFYPSDTPLVATVSGSVGLSAGTTDQGVSTDPAGGGATSAEVVYHKQILGPYKAGTTVTIAVGVEGSDAAKTQVELVVDKLYRGAIRMGLSGVMGNAVDRTYSAESFPGSATPEISVIDGGNLDVELVIAYAAFLDKDGRGTVSACYPKCFAPYVGLGIVTVGTDTGSGADRFKALKSVYLGMEWEPIKNFSIALTAVPRRVSRLQDGLEVGDALNQGATTVPIRSGFVVGGGLVINLSSDFFRTAAKSSDDILSGS